MALFKRTCSVIHRLACEALPPRLPCEPQQPPGSGKAFQPPTRTRAVAPLEGDGGGECPGEQLYEDMGEGELEEGAGEGRGRHPALRSRRWSAPPGANGGPSRGQTARGPKSARRFREAKGPSTARSTRPDTARMSQRQGTRRLERMEAQRLKAYHKQREEGFQDVRSFEQPLAV